MARPRKDGLDYYPHDTDAHGDEKLKMFRAIHGLAGVGFYWEMLERIYRKGSGELVITEDLKRLYCVDMRISEKSFDRFMNDATRIGLFSADDYKKRNVITSCGIKKRLSSVNKKREDNRTVSATETKQKPDNNMAETPERKGKERKEKERGKETLPKTPPEIAEEKAREAYPVFRSEVNNHLGNGIRLSIRDPISRKVFTALGGLDAVKGLIAGNGTVLESAFVKSYVENELNAYEQNRSG